MIVDRLRGWGKLRVRGKLNLLLLLPLAAVVLVSVPFVLGQVGNARSSATTADAARNARQLGGLVWELQRERLLTAGYLADPGADDAAMLLQQQVVADSAEALRQSLGTSASDELSSALVRLGSLAELRQNARTRGVAQDSVARTYHAVIEALIEALRLVPQRTSDAEGTRQLTALDALLRANEESALRGMALIAAAVSPQVGRDLLATASAQSQMFTERFVQQADADQAALVVLVDQGDAAHRVDALVQRLPNPADPDAVQTFVSGALEAADAQASLRRLVQDQVTSQIADAAAGRAGTARAAAWTVGLGVVLLLALVLGLAVMVSRSIAQPLQRLTRAATAVAILTNTELVRVADVEQVDEQPLRLAAIEVSSGDEVGELAVAFNQVQANAAMLLERQVVTRRNVSLMFANVAQRTQNLVRRQLDLVDDLERDEQNTRLLTRLYRLDHLSTRLRRSAENLLVVAGSRDKSQISVPTPLTTVLRSALAEIEDYQRVSFGAVPEATVVAPLVSDLVLVFAELLENATAFSPPQSTVDVHATTTAGGWCQISIVDHGIGMTASRLIEENRRLVERERLDVVPTSVLGLFVVGRLARRHGLAVRLEATPGGGSTASVAIPPALYVQGTVVSPPARTLVAAPRPPTAVGPRASVPAIPTIAGTFPWFAPKPDDETATIAAVTAAVVEAQPPAEDVDRRGNLHRRVPGAQLPAAAGRLAEPVVPAPPVRDASAARSAMDAFQTAVLRAGAATAPPAAPAYPPPGRPAATTPPAGSAPTTPPAGSAPTTPPAGVASALPRRVANGSVPDGVASALPRRPVPGSLPGQTGSGSPSGQTGNGSVPPGGGAASLSRRTPGASLAPDLREAPLGTRTRRMPDAPTRDPEAERAAFDGYSAALAEAARQTAQPTTSHDQFPGGTKEGLS